MGKPTPNNRQASLPRQNNLSSILNRSVGTETLRIKEERPRSATAAGQPASNGACARLISRSATEDGQSKSFHQSKRLVYHSPLVVHGGGWNDGRIGASMGRSKIKIKNTRLRWHRGIG